MNKRYRAEIDGLRALAVVPVVLFHAGFELFSGGFVGVDVFFVISGYLITTILIEDIENNRFSIVNFYERRARRILPALFFVMLVCIPFAWMWMLPSQMKDFSQSLIAVSLFASNVLFWRESGYFAAAAEEKPLLHTWSLSVEEQYYLLFPVFLILTWRFGKNRVFWTIVVFAAMSLALSEWGWRNKATANFYLAPTRAWELLAGSIAAFVVQKRGVQASNSLSLLGLAAIVFAIFVYDEKTPFPSVYALVPVFGVVLLVLFADEKTLTARLLSTRAFVGVGLISYSAYLWHQPLFAFARIESIGGISQTHLTLLSLMSFVLAYVSWRFVETPFRKKDFLARGTIFSISVLGILVFVSMGLYGHVRSEISSRLGNDRIEYLNYFENELPEWRYFEAVKIPKIYRNECNFYDIPKYRSGNPTQVPLEKIDESCITVKSQLSDVLFIWGDSHAQQFNYGFSRNLDRNWEVLQVASSGCNPSLTDSPSDFDYCQTSNYFAVEQIKNIKPNIVVLAQKLGHDPGEFKTIASWLLRQGVEKVLVVGPTPRWDPDLPQLLLEFWPSFPTRTAVGILEDVVKLDETLKSSFGPGDGLVYISVIDILCNEAGCLTTTNGNHKDGITTWDYGHLTPNASDFVVGKILSTHQRSIFDK